LPGFVFFSLLDFLGKYEEMDLGIDWHTAWGNWDSW
jgi:hypothetical protein